MSSGTEDLPPGVVREGGNNVANPSLPIPMPVKIDPFPTKYTWTNDTSLLDIATYFDPGAPNLAVDFGLDGLQPVIRQIDGDVFLVQDKLGKFYKWSSRDGQMWLLDGLVDVKQAMHAIMRDSGIVKQTAVWNTKRHEGN
ncbi:uncharacterized protein Z520_10074 [Fonsecaea multimorphosa CBS 102226]|uniref:Uncharacterized protein n=1 Tax=Fonsecaea multimorphosa CBS 102226 TaxID=1442371 RepID=A0A0D2KBL5_9EURO|nr:uncharacterized protein Z520_10074 [Fonsecaea multimorphosa CBS 102226]KIX94048.1 hypothetical protein Z520_10074 [Fonsecaea multimorphosa CBS 102226]